MRCSPSTARKARRCWREASSSCAGRPRRCRWCDLPTVRTTTCCGRSWGGAPAKEAGMLRALRVSDLAIIDTIELVLEPGFNVVTGETGAGKSILLQALDVALGGRPDADLVRAGSDEAVVEALFEDVPPEVRDLLGAAGLSGDAGGQVLVRRVIGRGGRTRAYVNGALGSLGLLRDLAPLLLHVYGQDEHQALRRVESHRDLLDA